MINKIRSHYTRYYRSDRLVVPYQEGGLDYGTQMVGGVTPGKAALQLILLHLGTARYRLPVLQATVADAVAGTGANASGDLRTASFAADAILSD